MKRLTILPFLAACTSAHAATWEMIPWAFTRAQYESNAAYISEEDIDGSSSLVGAGLDARRATERSEVFVNPRVELKRFLEDELQELDQESYFLDMGASRTMERSGLGIRGRFSEQPAYQSELDDAIPDDPDDPLPSGGGDLTVRDDKQQTMQIQPTWDYKVSPRDSISLRGRFLDVGYDGDSAVTGRYDYADTSLRTVWERQIAARHALLVSGEIGSYSADSSQPGVDSQSDYYGGSLGYRWLATQTGTMQVNLGTTQTDLQVDDPVFCTDPDEIEAGIPCRFEDTASTFTGDVSWRVRTPLTRINLGLGSSVNPTSRGTQKRRLESRLIVNRKFTERLSGNFGLVGYRQESMDSATDDVRDYISSQVEAEWMMTPNWRFSTGCRFTHRTTDQQGIETEEFDNYAVYMSVSWQADHR